MLAMIAGREWGVAGEVAGSRQQLVAEDEAVKSIYSQQSGVEEQARTKLTHTHTYTSTHRNPRTSVGAP